LEKNLRDYDGFMRLAAGQTLGGLLQPVAAAFLFVLYATMLAASGAALNEVAGLPQWAGAAAMAGLCLATLLSGVEGLVEVNSFLAPVMVAGGIFVGLFAALERDAPAFLFLGGGRGHWAWAGLTYAAYNIVTAVPVLCSLGGLVRRPSAAFWGGVVGGGVMTLLGACMTLPLLIFYRDAAPFEIPLLYIVHRFGPAMEYFYLLLLLMAIFTTAAANGFALVEWLALRLSLPKGLVKILVTALALGAARFGFSNFVAEVYPVFGIFGGIEIILIATCFINVIIKQR
jgi:uncharacterized membrane protein YkvI